MLTKRVFSLSRNLKSLVVLSQNNVIYDCQRYERFKSNQLLSQSINVDDNSDETNFDSVSGLYNTLDLLENDNKNFDGSSIIAEVNNLYSRNKKTLMLNKLESQPSFQNLSTNVFTNIEKLNISEILKILAVLVDLKISSNSKLISSLLKKIESNLSTSSIKYYCVIANIILKMEPTPLTLKIYQNLKKQFLPKFTMDFKENDINFLIYSLVYVCYHLPNQKIVYLILDALSKCKLDRISVNQVKLVLKSINKIDRVPLKYVKIVQEAQTALINNIDDVKKKDILYLLYICNNKVISNGYNNFYNSTLMDKFAEKIIKEDLNFDNAISCLTLYNKVKHINKNLLSYLSAIFYEEHELLESKKLYNFNHLLVLLLGLSYERYKPIFWDTLYNKYYKNGEIFECTPETQLIYCFNLASLDCYDSSILEKVFTTDFTKFPKSSVRTYIRLWQKLQTIPNYDGPQPSLETLKKYDKLIEKTTTSLLSKNLEKALNGSQYFKENLKSKLFHELDYVFIYKKGEDPTPQIIDQDVEYVEDLNVPDDCQIVILVVLPIKLFVRNTDQLLGQTLASYDYLTSRSCKIVPISEKKCKIILELGISSLINEIKSQLMESNTHEVC